MPDKQPAPIVGAVPVLVMPFDENGAVDGDSLRRQIDFCVEAGSQAIAFGMGSESHMLTDAEREQVWSASARRLNGALPLIAATAHPSHEGVIALTRLARECGADCAMVNPETRSGDKLVALFRDLSDRVGLPLMVQDAAGNAPAEVLLRAVREAASVTCLKIECPGTPHKIGVLMDGLRQSGLDGGGEREITVLGGSNGNLLPEELERGAVGSLPHPALIDAFRTVCDRYAAGDIEGALDCYYRCILPLSRLVLAGGAAGGQIWMHKTIFLRAGILRSAHCRAPAASQPEWVMEKVWAHLKAADLCISGRL